MLIGSVFVLTSTCQPEVFLVIISSISLSFFFLLFFFLLSEQNNSLVFADVISVGMYSVKPTNILRNLEVWYIIVFYVCFKGGKSINV